MRHIIFAAACVAATIAGATTDGALAKPPTEKVSAKVWYELKEPDLLAHSIWVLSDDIAALSGAEDEVADDTTLVKPLPEDKKVAKEILENYTGYVRTRFNAADGTSYLGLSKFGNPHNKGLTIVTKEGTVGFFWGIHKPTEPELQSQYKKLNKTADKLFPLTYTIDATADGLSLPNDLGPGTIAGFTYVDASGEKKIENSAHASLR